MNQLLTGPKPRRTVVPKLKLCKGTPTAPSKCSSASSLTVSVHFPAVGFEPYMLVQFIRAPMRSVAKRWTGSAPPSSARREPVQPSIPTFKRTSASAKTCQQGDSWEAGKQTGHRHLHPQTPVLCRRTASEACPARATTGKYTLDYTSNRVPIPMAQGPPRYPTHILSKLKVLGTCPGSPPYTDAQSLHRCTHTHKHKQSRQVGRQMDTKRHREAESERERERKREREREREWETQSEGGRERESERQREGGRERERESGRVRVREGER